MTILYTILYCNIWSTCMVHHIMTILELCWISSTSMNTTFWITNQHILFKVLKMKYWYILRLINLYGIFLSLYFAEAYNYIYLTNFASHFDVGRDRMVWNWLIHVWSWARWQQNYFTPCTQYLIILSLNISVV